MNSNLQLNFSVDKENNKINVQREFAASVAHVWSAWTESELLDQWWAPHPWKTVTKSMDFKTGGHWLYAMQGPDETKIWARIDYTAVAPLKSFAAKDAFCDENGKINNDYPGSLWNVGFTETVNTTMVDIVLTFTSLADLEKTIEMGFKEGFIAALENLDQYLEAKFKLRNEYKTNVGPRVSTYLNFPGNTEEAFLFYKSVFGTEFTGKGIQRFGEIPTEAGQPPIADNIKKMVLHVELPILGGHVLMATDAPKEMGFTLSHGNNMHICLEPTTKAETKKLFDALSAGGTITMPLADMFFGAYFGECTDKYGINWMFNCIER